MAYKIKKEEGSKRGSENFKKGIFLFIATGAFTGFFPFASGTVATVLAVIICFLLKLTVNNIIYFIITMFIMYIGIVVSDYAEYFFQEKDPHEVVIDEIAGYMFAMFLLPAEPFYFILTFFLFRIFDIFKFHPINKLQELEGGMGIMMDDIVAGIFVNMLVHLGIFDFLIPYIKF